MQKYFISESEFTARIITGDDAFHIKTVMRGKPGDEIIVNNVGQNYLVSITDIDNKGIHFIEVDKLNGNSELPFFVVLFQGYPKGDKLEDIIKHGTELGVNKITPVIMERTIVKLDSSKVGSKTIRFNRIAKEAAEQSNRNVVPIVTEPSKLAQIDFSEYDVKILLYEEEAKKGLNQAFKAALANIKNNSKVALVVGPEGGISPNEAEVLVAKGFVKCGLGPRILRTETVVFYVLSALSYEWELK